MSAEPVVVAVIVTWNRRDLLGEALGAVLAQSRVPDRVVVVDNASTDGTDSLLAAYPEITTLRTAQNLGGAGGFALGVREAVDSGCDLVWLMDDDTIPERTALAELIGPWSRYRPEPPALVASRVVWTDGRDHPMNTPRVRPRATAEQRRLASAVGCFPIRSASFVSVLVDADAVRVRGLPIADYFLWNDDFEFTTRIIRDRPALAAPGSVVVHKTAAFGSTDVDPGERFYYEVRNKVWLFTRSRGLAPLEKVTYGGATLLRWTRTIARSKDRRSLVVGLVKGLSSGLRRGPSPNDEVLAAEPSSRRVGADGDG